MFLVRIAVGLAIGYAVLVAVGWLFQERLAFPAPRAPVPDPKRLGIANGERIEVVTQDGTRLAGWYLPPALHRPPPPSPALLWFYGNGENIASLAPILRAFQPREAALLVVDYPGYGGSEGRATEAGLYAAAGAARGLVARARGMRVAAAAPGPVEVVLSQNAGHNDTYDVGGDQYRDKVWEFVGGRGR